MGSSSMWMTLLLPALLVATISAPVAETATLTKGCVDKCGDVDIPYPFGIGNVGGKDCFHKGFEISCGTDSAPVLVGTGQNTRVLSLSLSPHPVARVMLPVAWQCSDSAGKITSGSTTDAETGTIEMIKMNPDGVYRISRDLNELVVLGCSTLGVLQSGVTGSELLTACVTYTNNLSSLQDGECWGAGCCSADLPMGLTNNMFLMSNLGDGKLDFCLCDYGFIVEKGHYNFTQADLHMDGSKTTMPMSLDWAIRDNGPLPLTCAEAAKQPGYACKGVLSQCVNSKNGPGYTCNCTKGYEGNPYVDDGCTDIDECAHPADYSCHGKCKNVPGHYECHCRTGYNSKNPFTESCNPIIPLPAQICIGLIGGMLLLAFLSFIIIIRKERRMRHELYRRNGGPILEKASIIKLFKKEDLTPMLKPSNIIGKGGFGEVYKGLIDGVWVVVKKPISGNQMESSQFANEVIIQSKVIHKNIVRLIGCCLEVDTPMLVYEFISQGSMEDILHGGEKKPLDLDARINIAAASAHGLAYMHSQANTVILHGDVKPANILLDDNFMPKISDFGISRLIARDNEHAALVIGDITYMDPVYMQSGLLTEKSDVYSFGVVILELISRKKATHPGSSSLVNSFLENHKKGKKSTELFDMEILEGAEDILQSLTEIAIKCLDLEVDRRPTMSEVAEQLVAFTRSRQITIT